MFFTLLLLVYFTLFELLLLIYIDFNYDESIGFGIRFRRKKEI